MASVLGDLQLERFDMPEVRERLEFGYHVWGKEAQARGTGGVVAQDHQSSTAHGGHRKVAGQGVRQDRAQLVRPGLAIGGLVQKFLQRGETLAFAQQLVYGSFRHDAFS